MIMIEGVKKSYKELSYLAAARSLIFLPDEQRVTLPAPAHQGASNRPSSTGAMPLSFIPISPPIFLFIRLFLPPSAL